MLQTIAAHIQELPLAVQMIGACVILAVADFLFALAAAFKPPNTFHGTLFAQWITSKGLPILTIALLYGLDAAVKLFVSIDVGGTDLGGFGILAAGMAGTFIAQETFSIVKNAKMFSSPPIDEPVPDEVTGG